MAAPKGNKFWRLRSKHGRDELFSTPELLWAAAESYFDWCDKHPWQTIKNKTRGNSKEREETSTQRPYSISGLLLHLGVSHSYWSELKKRVSEQNNKDFSDIITRIEQIIETQQFEGAVVGAFNANIIARKLGLSDKAEKTEQSEETYDFLNFIKKVNQYDK